MISFECPSCGKRLNAPEEGAGRDGRCGCGATFTIPHHGDAAEPIDCEPDPIPRRRRKSSAPPALVIGGVFLLGIITVVVVVAALWRNARVHEQPKETAKNSAKNETSNKPAGDPRWTVHDDADRPSSRKYEDESASGMSNWAIAIIILVALLAYLVFVVMLAIWVVKDCRNRSIENGIFWMLLIFPFNVLGFIIYLASRPNGTLIRCEHCRNKRLAFVGICPHCHQDVRSRGAGPD